MNQAERFLALFKSNPRSTGGFDPKSGTMLTTHEACTPSMIVTHLAGTHGVGLVPIQDDATCWWAAIDIDNHGQDEDIPIGPIDKAITSHKLPLVPCRSKSGGVHVYAFFESAWPAAKVRVLMAQYAVMVKHPKAEIFPKQAILRQSSKAGEDKQFGNWINMPYLGGDDTVRYGYRHGHKLSLEAFLKLAEETKVTHAAALEQVLREHPEAPPCIQAMINEGVGKGQRNEALYNITVYTRKAFGDSFVLKAREFNQTVFDTPLSKSEAERTIGSAARPEYRYRCNEEPQRSLCDRDTCLTREFGITPSDSAVAQQMQELPEFTCLTKYVSEPVRWEIKVDGKLVGNIPTEILLDWRRMRMLIADAITKVVPMIKPQEWERILQEQMATARISDTPDDASPTGMVRERLREFAAKAKHVNGHDTMYERQALLRGLPILQEIDGFEQVVFRAQDFQAYLKRMKSDELKGVNTWFAVREIGVRTMKLRVTKDKTINVWMLPSAEVKDDTPDAPEFKSEL